MQKMGEILNKIVFSAIFDLYWPKIRMEASNTTFAESHKRALTFVFMLYIVDTVNFYHKDRHLKDTAQWRLFPSLLLSI